MKHILYIVIFFFCFQGFSQETRLIQLESLLNQKSLEIEGLKENIELELRFASAGLLDR